MKLLNDIYGEVRGDGLYYSLKGFIQPDDPTVQELASVLATDKDPVATAQDFVHKIVKYKRQNGEMWRYPHELLALKPRYRRGDCDDMAILLCSILRNYYPAEDVYVAVGGFNGGGHAWVTVGSEIVEPTAGSSHKIIRSKYHPEAIFNDIYAYAKPSEFGFLLVGGKYNFKVG